MVSKAPIVPDSTPEKQILDVIRQIVKLLVNNPDSVDVQSSATDNSVIYDIKVAPQDVGQVVGKGGKNANAIRQLVHASIARYKVKALVNIVEYRKR